VLLFAYMRVKILRVMSINRLCKKFRKLLSIRRKKLSLVKTLLILMTLMMKRLRKRKISMNLRTSKKTKINSVKKIKF
jgi:hypothetical protein